MSGQINQYPTTVTRLGVDDLLDVDKYLGEVPIGVNPYDSQKMPGSVLIDLINSNQFDPYDSGQKAMNWWNGTFGFANTGDINYKPNIRVIERIASMNGLLVLPLMDALGALLSTGVSYTQTDRNSLFLSGTQGGWQIDAKGACSTVDPVIPLGLAPLTLQILTENTYMDRVYVDTNNRKTRLQSFISIFYIFPDGRLGYASIENLERDGSTNPLAKTNSLLQRKITSRFENGDKIMKFDNYMNSYSSTGVLKTVNNFTNTNSLAFDCDATQGEQLGAFIMRMNMSWNINPNNTIAEIETAFNSI